MRKREREEKILDVDASMQGNMVFRDPVNLRINGTFEGGLNTKGILTIGENASVKASIKGEVITVAGTVYGDIEATKSLRIIPPAKVVGDVKAPVLSIGEGAIFEGSCRMLLDKAAAKELSAKEMLTAEEVARYLEVDTSLILNWAKEGKLPCVKDKDVMKFDRASLDEWIANEKIR